MLRSKIHSALQLTYEAHLLEQLTQVPKLSLQRLRSKKGMRTDGWGREGKALTSQQRGMGSPRLGILQSTTHAGAGRAEGFDPPGVPGGLVSLILFPLCFRPNGLCVFERRTPQGEPCRETPEEQSKTLLFPAKRTRTALYT